MKAVFPVMLILMVAILGCSNADQAGQAEAEATTQDAKLLGEPITIAEATDINAMMAHPNDFLNKPVMISGEVMGRCSGSGCWISINRGEDAEGLIVQAADKSFIFPEECVGQNVAIQGTLMLRNPEAMAEEHEHEEGASDHVCPNPEYFFAPTGLKIGA